MPMQSDTWSVGKIVRAVVRATPDTRKPRVLGDHPPHDIGDNIAALDEHWVFRKTR